MLVDTMAGYEELQEGLAVLAEYLVGGLNRTRMQQLAARVLAIADAFDAAEYARGQVGLCRPVLLLF